MYKSHTSLALVLIQPKGYPRPNPIIWTINTFSAHELIWLELENLHFVESQVGKTKLDEATDIGTPAV